MELERKQDISVYRWLSDIFKGIEQTGGILVTVVDGFPAGNLVLPTVSIEREDIDLIPFQLGSRNGLSLGIWRIDIFAKTKTQRDEIGYKILHLIEDGINVYNYDEGFPEPAYPTRIGTLLTDDIKMTFIKVFPETVDTLYWRSQILFTTQYESQI